MAIAQVQKKSGTGATSLTVSFDSTPTEGNLLVASFYDSTAGPNIDGWTQAVAVVMNGATANSGIWYKIAGASESKDVVLTGGASLHMGIAEYGGFVGTPTLDKTASNASASTTNAQTTGTTDTTTANDELCLGAVGIPGSGSSPSWSNSFAAVNTSSRHHQAEKVVSSTGAYETTDTWTGTAVKCFGCIATFKGVASTAIAKVSGVARASISKISGVAIASAGKVNGIS